MVTGRGGCSASASVDRSGPTERVRELTARVPFLAPRVAQQSGGSTTSTHLLFMVIGGRIANALWWFDREVVGGTVNAIGRDTACLGARHPPMRPATCRTTRSASPSGSRWSAHISSWSRDRRRHGDSHPTVVTFLPLAARVHRAAAIPRRAAASPPGRASRGLSLVRSSPTTLRMAFQFISRDARLILGIQYKGRRRRAVGHPGRPHDDPDGVGILASFKPIDPDQGVHGLLPRARGRPHRVFVALTSSSSTSLGRPRPDVPDVRMGRREPDTRRSSSSCTLVGRC